MQNVQSSFNDPSTMDCKIGIRTYYAHEISICNTFHQQVNVVNDENGVKHEKNLLKACHAKLLDSTTTTSKCGFRIEVRL